MTHLNGDKRNRSQNEVNVTMKSNAIFESIFIHRLLTPWTFLSLKDDGDKPKHKIHPQQSHPVVRCSHLYLSKWFKK